MKYSVLLPILILWWSLPAFAAALYPVEIASENSTECRITEQHDTGLVLLNTIDRLDLIRTPTDGGEFLRPEIEGYTGGPWENGAPQLPVRNISIEIPQKATVRVQVEEVDETLVSLEDLLPGATLFPVQPPRSKAILADNTAFYYDETRYGKNLCITPERVRVDIRGTLRSMRLARLTLCPFRYNPVTNKLWVAHRMTVSVVFESADLALTRSVKKRYQAETFEAPLTRVAGKLPLSRKTKNSNSTVNGALTYVVVAPASFLSNTALQELITWKKRSGFHVIEADTSTIYPENGDDDDKRASLKTYLETLYNDSDSPPAYVLLVGDTSLIPAYKITHVVLDGMTLDAHYTDLYYCEYTGDALPDVYYGRFPVSTGTELSRVASKSLHYETCTMPSLDHLGKSVLIAGADAVDSPTYANGQVAYLLNEYINTDNGFSDITAFFFSLSGISLFGDTPPWWENTEIEYTGSTLSTTQFLESLSPGAGFVNYTGHCNEFGWFNGVRNDFELDFSHVDDLWDTNQFGFYIANCCESSRLEMSRPASFGAELLLAGQKGAAVYLGAANETFWEADFTWAVGYKAYLTKIEVPFLGYDDTGYANVDALMHTHNESPGRWFTTAGQMVYAGNLAVDEGLNYQNFDISQYYWEIYNVMGDPALSPYMGDPAIIPEPDAVSVVPCRDSRIDIRTEPYARVALSTGQELLGASLADENGDATVSFTPLNDEYDLDLVITKQNHQPLEVFFQTEALPADATPDMFPLASFYAGSDPSGQILQVVADKAVTFTNTSTGCPTAFSWDFEGADIPSSTDPTPTVTYSDLGTYAVTLSVTNDVGTSEPFEKYVCVSPNVDFLAGVTTTTPGEPVTFTPACSHPATSWTWSFPGADPESSSEENPRVAFPAVGHYSASLSVTIEGETYGPVIKSAYIQVKNHSATVTKLNFSDGITRGGGGGSCFIGSLK